MKKLLLFTMSMLVTFMVTRAQQPLTRQWTSFHNGTLNGFDKANALITDSNGNVYVTGQSIQNSANGSITTVKYDANGSWMWTDNYKGNITYAQNIGEDICLDPFGNVLVTATVATNDGDLSILKFNQQGRIWAVNKEPWWQSSYDDFAKEIATDNLGNIYCAASIMSIGGNMQDLFTIKCDSAGNDIWSAIYTSASGADWAEGLAVTPDGHCFSITSSFNFFGTSSYDMQTLHYDSTGAQQWVSSYNFQSPQSEDYPLDIICDAASNTWVCGAADVGSTSDMACYKQNIYGTRLWTVTYNGNANDNDSAIAVSFLPNNLTVVTGRSREMVNGSAKDVITTMLIDSGVVLWTVHYYGDSLNAIPTSLKTDINGNIYIAGYFQTASGTNGVVLVYDQAGNLIYSDAYNGTANLNDRFNDLVLDNQGFIYVTGQSYTASNNSDYVTIKYAMSGVSGTPESVDRDKLVVYPNPASTEVNIRSNNDGINKIQISDLTGKLLYTKAHNDSPRDIKLPIENLVSGVYFIRIWTGNNIRTNKIMIN